MKDNSESLPVVDIFTDGGCEPNPGAGGYGVVLFHPKTKQRKEADGGFRKTTNNRMEIFAVIAGLEMLKQRCGVTVYSDSQYVVNAMTKWVPGWKRKGWWLSKTRRPENVDLWQRLDALCQTHQVEFHWLKGHAGHLENERCDQLAMAALRNPNLPADYGYENRSQNDSVRPDMQEGDGCYKCSTPLMKQAPRSKPKRGYYYEFYLWCPKCQATYQVESAKRAVKEPSLLL